MRAHDATSSARWGEPQDAADGRPKDVDEVEGRWQCLGMAIEVRPATGFGDVKTMVGPKRPDANVCWCLSYRLTSSKENRDLVGRARGERVQQLVRQNPPPGVLAYDGDDVVGWAAVHPRADTSFASNRKIPHVDDLDVWSVWCIRVRPGHRGEGISHHLLAGAVEFARANGAPAIEGYPLDNKGAKIDLTMAYVGTMSLFEKAGFAKAADTDSVLNGFPRVLMRLDLRPRAGDDEVRGGERRL
jgi:GNAT superfamily N-acetyltransferase